MASLKVQMAKGVMWTAAGKYTGIVMSIIISMVLARLICPEDFGVVAIAQVAISFVSILSDLGIGSAVIQNKTLDEKDLNSIFTFTVLLGITLFVLFCIATPFIANFYGNKKLIPVCIMIAISMMLNTISSVPACLIMKSKRFAFIAKRDLFFGFISGIISIVYAFLGGGCYAIVLPSVITSTCLLCVNLHQYPQHIDWHLNIEPLKKIFSFSIFQFLFSIINYFSRNLDKLIIGKALNLKELGYYQKSYSFMMMPMQNITFVITPVIQPFLSDFQNDLHFISEKNLDLVKLVATISFPLGILLCFTGYEIIYIMFGKNWLPAVPPFEILAWSIPLQMVLSTSGSIFQSSNNTKMLFVAGAINTCQTIIGFILCTILKGGLNGFALAWTITNATNFITTYFIMYRFVFHRSSLIVYKQFAHPLINGMLIFVLSYLINIIFDHKYIVLTLVLKCIIALACTLITISLFKDYDLKRYLKSIKEKIHNSIH